MLVIATSGEGALVDVSTHAAVVEFISSDAAAVPCAGDVGTDGMGSAKIRVGGAFVNVSAFASVTAETAVAGA